ncbi:MAG: hypothetical protein IT285_12870 [Bdellovibrionales bacterium]|nr:hypothetical protein [Bdellovibrionales bacterium]
MLGLWVLGSSAPLTASEAAPPRTPALQVRWEGGGETIAPFEVPSAEWFWPENAQEGPVLRAVVPLSPRPGWRYRSHHNLDFVALRISSDGHAEVELRTPKATASFRFARPDGTEIERRMVVEMVSGGPSLVAHPECRRLGLGFKTPFGAGRPFFVGIRCRRGLDETRVTILKSDEARWIEIGGLAAGAPPSARTISAAFADSARAGVLSVVLADPANRRLNVVVRRSGYPAFQRAGFSLGVGGTFLAYRETSKPDYAAFVLTPKLSYSRAHSPFKSWAFGFSAFLTAAVLSRSSGSVDPRFLGVNARLGYLFPSRSRMKFALYGGGYYLTMWVPGDAFGFDNLWGPQLYPTLSWKLSGRNSLAAYCKYSPMMNGFSALPLGNREIAAGLGWQRDFRGYSITLSADFANFAFSLDDVEVSSNSLTLGISVTL